MLKKKLVGKIQKAVSRSAFGVNVALKMAVLYWATIPALERDRIRSVLAAFRVGRRKSIRPEGLNSQ